MMTDDAKTTSGHGGSVEDQVTKLVARMTIEEKIAQLGSEWAFKLLDADGHLGSDATGVLRDGIGQVTRVAGGTSLSPESAAIAINEIQRHLVEHTRLGIPALVHEETLHGVMARDATIFQQAIGAAASFDPALHEEVAITIRKRMLAMGARQALAPVLDITRDPRWGRIEETYGEDPYVATVMGLAYVRGLQGSSLESGVVATGKHLVGHGIAEGGLNMAPVHVGRRELQDEQLVPFEAAVREVGLASMMPAYCDVDGVPCHASLELLTTILREEWGFSGVVVSDYLGIEQIATQHHLTDDMTAAAIAALSAGVDVDLPRSVAYGPDLAVAVREGRIDEAVVDEAVARVLRTKFDLGLFERPYVTVPSSSAIADLGVEERRLARRLAARSMVLLENDGVLPLPRDRRIAVIGPHAASVRDLVGDYSHVGHLAAMAESTNREVVGATFGSTDENELSGRRTILDAIRDHSAAGTVRYAVGTGIRDGSDADIASAVDVARDSDVAVVVLGERSGLTEDSTTGEFHDRVTLGFLGRQQELLEAIVSTGVPVALVVVSGRPLSLPWAAEHCSAVLFIWVPGEEGPDALADILFGDVAPGGRLPVTIPREVGQVPLTYRHRPSGGRSNPLGDYVDGPAGPLWPFGHGLSYTTFEVSGLELDSETISTQDGEVSVRVRVSNVGRVTGDEVVQLYARDEAAAVARPVLELCGFARLTLSPGESAHVRFQLHAEQLSYTSVDHRRVVEPGYVTLSVGTSSARRPLETRLELVGQVAEVRERRWFVTPTVVEAAEVR